VFNRATSGATTILAMRNGRRVATESGRRRTFRDAIWVARG